LCGEERGFLSKKKKKNLPKKKKENNQVSKEKETSGTGKLRERKSDHRALPKILRGEANLGEHNLPKKGLMLMNMKTGGSREGGKKGAYVKRAMKLGKRSF